MDIRTTRRSSASVVAACAVLGAAAAAPVWGIGVTVDSRPITFSGTPPMEMNGSVLVPLRGVFEAIGASVDYDAPSRTIYAHKGMTSVILPIGSQTATVDGQSRALSQPARVVGGATLVPLRFVAEALGATVNWRAASNTVEIQTAEPQVSALPAPPDGSTITGQLTGIYPTNDPPQITLRVNGRNTAVPISSSTLVLRSAPSQPGTQVALDQLSTGDQVTIQRAPDGTAYTIAATYGELRGTIKSIGRLSDGSPMITLNDGTTVQLAPGAPVTMAGRKMQLSDVMPDESVVIRTNPSNHVGYGVAVVTGNNPNPVPPVVSDVPGATTSVAIGSFSHDVSRPMHAGDVLTATLTGAPGGRASFAVPGVAEDVPMQEASPGVYVGKLTIPKNASISGAAVLGKLTVNGATSPLIQASTPVVIDSAGPKLVEVSPANGAAVDTDTPLIYGTISDAGGSGVNPNATRIALDGKEVTAQSTITTAFFNFRPAAPLAPGKHTIIVALADLAGNRTTTTIPFTVASSRQVRSFVSDLPTGQPASSGTTVKFTLAATPGGKATYSVGTLAKDVPMFESSPGVYVGTYTVSQGESATNLPVTARFTPKGGSTVTASLGAGLNIMAGKPLPPKILSPDDGSAVAETVTVRGTAAPGAVVRVKVDYVSKALGGLFAIRGSAGTQEVKADSTGQWTAADLALRTQSLLARDRDTAFTISAVAVNPNGDESAPTSVEVRRS